MLVSSVPRRLQSAAAHMPNPCDPWLLSHCHLWAVSKEAAGLENQFLCLLEERRPLSHSLQASPSLHGDELGLKKTLSPCHPEHL